PEAQWSRKIWIRSLSASQGHRPKRDQTSGDNRLRAGRIARKKDRPYQRRNFRNGAGEAVALCGDARKILGVADLTPRSRMLLPARCGTDRPSAVAYKIARWRRL